MPMHWVMPWMAAGRTVVTVLHCELLAVLRVQAPTACRARGLTGLGAEGALREPRGGQAAVREVSGGDAPSGLRRRW